jgi:hypothetical protein
MENLLIKRPELSRERLEKTRDLMNAIPDCLVFGYEPLEAGLKLSDRDDRDVLAAALHGGAQAIVTYNLTDFPESVLNEHKVIALHPDEFLVDLDLAIVQASVHRILQRRVRPPVSLDQYLPIQLAFLFARWTDSTSRNFPRYP